MWLTEIITLFHISIDYPDTGINVCGGYFSFDQNYLGVLSATRLYVADTTLLHRLFRRQVTDPKYIGSNGMLFCGFVGGEPFK